MNLFTHLAGSLRRPDHWLYASWLDVVTGYRKTYFGLLWVLIPTAIYIWGIGGFLGSLQPGLNLRAFLAHIGVGFVVYRLLSTVLTDATSTFAGYRAYIYDGNVRLTDYLLRMFARSMYYFLLVSPLMAAVVLASPEFRWSGVPASLLGLVVVVVNLFSLSVVFALLGARFPDISEFMGNAMLAGFLLTPIVWYPEMAPEGTMRGMLMRANPLHHLLAAVRAPLLGEPVEPLTLVYLAIMTVTGIAAAVVGYRMFARRVALWL